MDIHRLNHECTPEFRLKSYKRKLKKEFKGYQEDIILTAQRLSTIQEEIWEIDKQIEKLKEAN